MSEEPRLAPYPGPWGAFALTLGSWFATLALLVMMSDAETKNFGIGTLGIAQALGIGLVATIGARLVPPPQAERLGLQGFAPIYLVAIALFLPMSVVVSELTNLAHALAPPPDLVDVVERTKERLQVDNPLNALETVIVVVGIAPVVEEWLYRGVIQQGLVGHMGRAAGVLMTSALFGVAHMEPSLSPASSMAAFFATLPVGLMLGTLRLASGSLLAPILLHAGYNAVALSSLAFAERVPIPGYNAPGDHTPLNLVAGAAICVGIAGWLVWRDAQKAPMMIPIPPPEIEEEDEGGGWFG